MRPEADSRGLTGEYRRGIPGGPEHLLFQYEILRVWQEPAATFLAGGLGTVPLAPVANLGGQPIEAVIEAVGDRIEQVPSALGDLLWLSTTILMGLRFQNDYVQHLMTGVYQMEESTVYQAIIARGEARGEARGLLEGKIIATRHNLLELAEFRFSFLSETDRARIEGIDRIDRLEQIYKLLLTTQVTTWAEFWATV